MSDGPVKLGIRLQVGCLYVSTPSVYLVCDTSDVGPATIDIHS